MLKRWKDKIIMIMDINLEERDDKINRISPGEMKNKSFIPYSIRLCNLPIKNTKDNSYMSNINSLNIINMLPFYLYFLNYK
ncbi:hypothetical protein PFMG_03004 [Plasmodium falciparum IGH-CR14]|uniref:Uncharacterized protein n=1 Tax=Plasmodium falciparum IGH-CR14 TaxID=580059 RepID=A0A0L1IBF6_PLAFA|nr:hypothetical protein PFMG_03004 [Plasmodium falciparum IGH-CR14]